MSPTQHASQPATPHVAPTAWFTGLSGAGKTTLSQAVAAQLQALGHRVCLLDAGDIRRELFPDLGFSRADRDENVRRLGYLAGLMAGHGVITMVAAMSPERAARDAVRARIPNFVEVFVDAPVEICEQRDPIGLYRRFRSGEVCHLSGLDDPYESPASPEVHCLTATFSVEDCANQVVAAILSRLSPSEAVEREALSAGLPSKGRHPERSEGSQ